MLTDWIVAIGTIAVAIIAVFQDRIRSWLLRPKLGISVELGPPDCHKTLYKFAVSQESLEEAGLVGSAAPPRSEPVTLTHEAGAYYFKLRVTNTGNLSASNVEVIALELLRRQADGNYRRVETFLPMNLVWSHMHMVFFPAISPGTYKHVDLMHVLDPAMRPIAPYEDKRWPGVARDKTVMSFDTVVKSYALTHLVPCGTYRLVLQVAATNASPIKRVLEITLTGDWFEDEMRMLGEGAGIKLLETT